MLFRSANPYDHTRLTDKNIQNYILSSHLNYGDITLKSVNQLAIQPFLQEDFRLNQGSCSIASIATCIYYHCPQSYDINVIYAAVEAIASRYFYKPSGYGVPPIFIRIIYEKALDYFQLPHKEIKSKYINHIGFNYKTIKEQINQKNPVILSLFNDSRNYYKSHTVTVIGYAEFNLLDNFTQTILYQKKIKHMLLVYDNWTKEVSYIDPDIISPISSIVF